MPWLPADIVDGQSARTMRIDARGRLRGAYDAAAPFAPPASRWAELLSILGAGADDELDAFTPGAGSLDDVAHVAMRLALRTPRIATHGAIATLDYTPAESTTVLQPIMSAVGVLRAGGFVSLGAGDELDAVRASLREVDRPLFDATLAVLLATFDQEQGVYFDGHALVGPIGMAATQVAQMLVSDPRMRALTARELAADSNVQSVLGDIAASDRLTVTHRAIALFASALAENIEPVATARGPIRRIA